MNRVSDYKGKVVDDDDRDINILLVIEEDGDVSCVDVLTDNYSVVAYGAVLGRLEIVDTIEDDKFPHPVVAMPAINDGAPPTSVAKAVQEPSTLEEADGKDSPEAEAVAIVVVNDDDVS